MNTIGLLLTIWGAAFVFCNVKNILRMTWWQTKKTEKDEWLYDAQKAGWLKDARRLNLCHLLIGLAAFVVGMFLWQRMEPAWLGLAFIIVVSFVELFFGLIFRAVEDYVNQGPSSFRWSGGAGLLTAFWMVHTWI